MNGTVFAVSVKKSIHADKLKPGDTVDFRSEAATLMSGPVVVPRDAVFHGHVVQSVAAKDDPEKISRLSIVVDSATWKDKSVPVCAVISGFGSREIKMQPPQEPPPSSIASQPVNADWIKKQVIPANQSMVNLSDPNFGMTRLPDTLQYEESTVTIRPDQFVKGITIQRDSTGMSVLNRKNKNVDLPGGLLVALQQVPVTEGVCPAKTAP
jgi:hypothetical protein